MSRSGWHRRVLVLALGLGAALGTAPVLESAIRPAARPTSTALLVGIDQYEDAVLSRRRAGSTRVATLQRLAALLRDDYGFDVLVLSDAEATTASLYRALDDLAARQASGGQALVVLGTETQEVEGVTRVATFDARVGEPWALPSVSELRALMGRAGDGGVLVADGCVSAAQDSRSDLRQMQVQTQRYVPGKVGANVALLSGCPLGTDRRGDSVSGLLTRALEEVPQGATATIADVARQIGAAQPYYRIDLDLGPGGEPLVLHRAVTPSRVLARLEDPAQRAGLLAELGNPKQAATLRGTPEGERVVAHLLELAASGNEPESVRSSTAVALAAIGGDSAWSGLGDHIVAGRLGPTVGVAAVRGLAAQGESAAPVLRVALRAPEAVVVKEAVSALAALGLRQDLPAMLDAAHRTGDPDVQIAALSTVRRLGGGDLALAASVRGLLEARSTVAEVRSMAVLALGELGDESMTGALAHRLRADRDATVRQAAASALGQLAERTDRPEAVAALRAALDDDSELVREAAVVALGRLRVQESAAGLVLRLEDRAPAVKSAAAEALGMLGDANTLEPLVEALGDYDSSVRRSAAQALGRIGDAGAHEALIWKSATDADPYVRAAAREALDRLGCAPLDADQLAFDDRDPRVRAAELAWVSRCRHPGGGELLLRALSDPDESVRRAASAGLATLPAAEVLPSLASLARGGGGVAAIAAIEALGRIGGAEALGVVLEAAERGEAELRVAALTALGGFASADASRVLLASVAEGDTRVRSAALHALGAQARTYYLAEDWTTGIAVTERYLQLGSSSLAPAELAEAANNLAALYQRSGDLDRAQTLLEEALALREKALGPDHPATAVSLNNLAALYQERGQNDRAEPLFLKALKIRERALPPGDADTVQSMRNLAALYDASGRSAEAALYRAQAERAEKQRALLEAGR